jgi:transmembrane sensor
MGYEYFDVEDFAADNLFQKWVLDPDPETEKFWEQWLLQNPNKESIIKKATWIVRNVSFDETWTSRERADMWQVVQSAISNEESTTRTVPLWGRLRWVGAACILLFTFAAGMYFFKSGTIEVRTAYGELKDITLADGSHIKLNANSVLRYKRSFLAQATREIWIEGEGFFEIAKREVNGEKVPFVVHADNLDVQVLGTAFNVNNRHGKVDVALEHGSVKVTDNENLKNEVLLKPGERVTRRATDSQLISQRVEIKEYTSWKDHTILFKQKSLSEIAVMIKDMYDIDVTIEDAELAGETFTGTFPTDSVEVFFVKLQKMYPIEITQKGKHYHLK